MITTFLGLLVVMLALGGIENETAPLLNLSAIAVIGLVMMFIGIWNSK